MEECKACELDWDQLLGDGEGKRAHRSAPLSQGASPYWHAGARVLRNAQGVQEAVLILQGPDGIPQRLKSLEQGLVNQSLSNVDALMDASRDVLMDVCRDDEWGSAAVKAYMGAWLCAHVVGRCMA
ncbi:MAG: hypothetical protein MI717_09240 [Spirochaetales bacterium]|nr:hypothetical protein [Spirochaetales bacterium]